MKRRVVVTGLGMVTPLACGVEETWKRLLAGRSGAGPITRFDTSNVVTTYACEVPYGDGSDGTFNPDQWMEPKDRRKVDDFILYGMAGIGKTVLARAVADDEEKTRLEDYHRQAAAATTSIEEVMSLKDRNAE